MVEIGEIAEIALVAPDTAPLEYGTRLKAEGDIRRTIRLVQYAAVTLVHSCSLLVNSGSDGRGKLLKLINQNSVSKSRLDFYNGLSGDNTMMLWPLFFFVTLAHR